jgi:uncharacterized protein (AIM24 family)
MAMGGLGGGGAFFLALEGTGMVRLIKSLKRMIIKAQGA